MNPSDSLVLHPVSVPHAPEPAYPRRVRSGGGGAQLLLAGALAGATPLLHGCDRLFTIVAPLFEHGSGELVYGCIVVAPPGYTTEAEILTLIEDELRAAGYRDMQRDVFNPSYPIDRLFVRSICELPYDYEVLDGAVISDGLDLWDEEARLGVELVARNDCDQILVEFQGLEGCSVWGTNVLGVAEHVSFALAAGVGGGTVGIFYQPGITWEDTGTSWRDQMRAQVQDFVRWLEDAKTEDGARLPK